MDLRRVAILILIGSFLFGGGFFTRAVTYKNTPPPIISSTNQYSKYPLLGKRIFVDNPSDPLINFEQLRQSFNNYFKQNNVSGSLYFEYLPTGTSARVSADEQQVAASLMKLPAAMDMYKISEMGKINLDETITLQQSWLDPGYGDLYKKGAGYQLTLREAGKIMLEQSDNTALKAVTLTTLGLLQSKDSVLNAVDVDLTQNQDLTVSIGARSYASFLKCLYFACYDNYQDSEEMLSYLTQTPFDNRMVNGISDKTIKIAHKIGVYDTAQSDCGIVYVPNRNYIFCAMLKGGDNDTTNNQIAALSKLAYDYIKKQ